MNYSYFQPIKASRKIRLAAAMLASNRYMAAQVGISLIEMMLSITLGLSLMLGLMQTYLIVRNAYNLQMAINTLQENGRFATHFLSTKIRMAGYTNCHSFNTNPDLLLQGYHNTGPDFLKDKILKNTDSLVIWQCETQANKESLERLGLFIGATERKNGLGQTIYALYESPSSGYKRELVSNIEDMKIRYAILTIDNHQTESVYYGTADQISDWQQIKAVDIRLLLSSEQPVLPTPIRALYDEETLPKSRFLRREWDIYIQLRESS